MKSFQSRKFLLALLALGIGTLMSWFDQLDPMLVDLLKWTIGLYSGFNVSQKAAEMYSLAKVKEE